MKLDRRVETGRAVYEIQLVPRGGKMRAYGYKLEHIFTAIVLALMVGFIAGVVVGMVLAVKA
jgi:hypothetical protein